MSKQAYKKDSESYGMPKAAYCSFFAVNGATLDLISFVACRKIIFIVDKIIAKGQRPTTRESVSMSVVQRFVERARKASELIKRFPGEKKG
jgi:hypothetical protein